jgi:hypothetical protein
MDGEQFVKILKEEFEVKLGPVTEHQWRRKPSVSPTLLKNALHKLKSQLLYSAITQIVEFHKLNLHHGENVDSFAKRIADKKVLESLRSSKGVYAFYEGQGRLVYIGKTEKNWLFDEMNQRYKGKNAKKVRFRIFKKGRAKQQDARIADVAVYFSAYAIDPQLRASQKHT